jgi:hypothetical protein
MRPSSAQIDLHVMPQRWPDSPTARCVEDRERVATTDERVEGERTVHIQGLRPIESIREPLLALSGDEPLCVRAIQPRDEPLPKSVPLAGKLRSTALDRSSRPRTPGREDRLRVRAVLPRMLRGAMAVLVLVGMEHLALMAAVEAVMAL